MILTEFAKCCGFLIKFRGYEPQPVTPNTLIRWLWQFEPVDRRAALSLLDNVIFYNRSRITKALVNQNEALLSRLETEGIPFKNVIYLHIDEPGSSSSLMINLLRNKANLERRNWNVIDASNPEITKLIARLRQVAIVYVDDFLGSGTQFSYARKLVADRFPTALPEFMLAPCVCEEAYAKLSKLDVQVFADHIHSKAERSLHPNGYILEASSKARLQKISSDIDAVQGMGFGGLAAMVAMYHNTPDNVPRILRGNEGQDTFRGILPRTTDLPLRV